jgi:ferredoxin-NADP reductase
MQNLKTKSNSATLISKRELCQNTWEYTFSYEGQVVWKPGDYTYITLQKKLEDVDSRGLRRHISIAKLDKNKKTFSIAVRLRNSTFKNELHALNSGEAIEFTSPYGELVLPDDNNVPLIFIVGGIAITAILSVLQFLSEEKSKRNIYLFYFNKSEGTICYKQELERFTIQLSNLKIIYSMTSDTKWTGENERLSPNILQRHITEIFTSYFYIVGTEGMCQAAEDILWDLKIPDSQIWREDFTGY